MKKILFILISIAFLASCNQTQKQDKQEEVPPTVEYIQAMELDVDGMHCTGCENTIKKSVAELEGVKEVTASHTGGMAYVVYDTALTSLADIKAAIEGKGYAVTGQHVKDTIQ